MSDVVRVYDGRKSVGGRRRGLLPVGGGILVLLAFPVLLGYGCWTTRDRFPLERHIPARQTYHVVANDLLAKRGELSQSRVWQVLPASGVADVSARLAGNLGLPEWVLNNIIPKTCHVWGEDIRTFADWVIVTRMTRIGCLLERLNPFVPGIDHDWSGGLDLRHIARPGLPEGGVYYAVRGRILLVSRARDKLVRALTLLPEDSWDQKAFADTFSNLGSDDLCGVFTLAPDDPLGKIVKNASFALRIESDGAFLKLKAALRPEYQQQYEDLFGAVSPQPLVAPPPGILELSLNMQRPVSELWTMTGRLLDEEDQFQNWWKQYGTPRPEDGAAPAPYPLVPALMGLVAPLGPGIRLSWLGMDLNEMAPVPLLVMTADTAEANMGAMLAQVPPPPVNAQPWEMYLRVDAEKKRAWLPFVGGPNMQPVFGAYGAGALVSTSTVAADGLWNEAAKQEALPQHGNLYVAMRPGPCLKAVTDTVQLLSEAGIMDPATYGQALQSRLEPYLAGANTIDRLVALAAIEKGQMVFEAQVKCVAETKTE